jgi:co-chaperonin GroES (HSP10)
MERSASFINQIRRKNVKVIRDALLVRLTTVKVTEGGIHIPETTDDTVQQGEIVARGRGLISGGRVIEPEVQIGDKITFRSSPMIPIKEGDETYYIIAEGQILVIH